MLLCCQLCWHSFGSKKIKGGKKELTLWSSSDVPLTDFFIYKISLSSLYPSHSGESAGKEMRKPMHRKGQNQVFNPGCPNSQLRLITVVLSTDLSKWHGTYQRTWSEQNRIRFSTVNKECSNTVSLSVCRHVEWWHLGINIQSIISGWFNILFGILYLFFVNVNHLDQTIKNNVRMCLHSPRFDSLCSHFLAPCLSNSNA